MLETHNIPKENGVPMFNTIYSNLSNNQIFFMNALVVTLKTT